MRSIRLASTSSCTGCHSCSNACPSSSIKMMYNKYGFLQPTIDSKSCLKCHLCEKVCPIISPNYSQSEVSPDVYAAIIKEKQIRQESSSGGAFWAFASNVIEKGGVVFGVCFDGTQVKHSYTDRIDGLRPFMGSKYVQSEIGSTFKDAKQFLAEGRTVLFTGTPCQIAGLNHYLRKDYPNLITLEILCRGVSSPQVWEKYIKGELIKKQAKEIKEIRFRTKSPHYKSPIYSYVLRYFYLNQDNNWVEFWEDCLKNPFFSFFLCHNFRFSCYQCKFRNTYSSGADITIGDAVSNPRFEAEGEKKESAIIIHTDRGRKIFETLRNTLLIEVVDIKDLLASYHSSTVVARRDRCFKPYRLIHLLALRCPLEKIRKLYEYTPFVIRAYYKLRAIFKK